MFGRRDSQDSVDVNDFIVGDNLSAAGAIPNHTSAPAPSVDIRDDDILEADYAHADPEPKTRLRKSKVAILLVCATFAAGGISSILFQTPESSVALGFPQPAPVPAPAEVNLPPGLAAPTVETATSAAPAITGQDQVPAPQPAGSVTTEHPAPSMAPSVAAPTAAVSPAQTGLSAPNASAAVPAVAATPAPATTPPAATAPPATPAISPSITAHKDTATPAVAPSTATVATASTSSKTAAADQKGSPAPAPAKKIVVSVKPASPQPSKSSSPTPTERDHSEETVKRLVSVSAEAFGLQAIQEGSITLEAKRGQASQRLHVGDRLPSGEQLLRIDARSMTLVTDRSVIRIN